MTRKYDYMGRLSSPCATVYHCAIQRTHKHEHKSIQTQTNMAVLVEAQTVATCSEIIVTTIVQQSGSLRAAFQTLMDFVRLLTPSRRVEKIPHGWDNRSNIERKTVDSMKRKMFVYLRIQSKTLFQGKEYAGGPTARFWNCIQRETALVPSQW